VESAVNEFSRLAALACLLTAGCASGSGGGSQAELEPPPEYATPEILAALESASYTVAPEIANRAVVAHAMEEEYRQTEAYEQGISGSVGVAFLVDDQGQVQRAVVHESSGRPDLDRAGLDVASVTEFTPAMDGDRPVAAWITIPISFTRR
jgi:protein TonB